MAVSADFRNYVLEQLGGLGHVVARRMFGGVGLYHDELFFALIDDDTLYFKVSAATRESYARRGMQPFCPFPDKPDYQMGGYYQVPPDILEEGADLVSWAREACGVALQARTGKRKAAKKRTVAKKRKLATSGKAAKKSGGAKKKRKNK